jgi:hypothetical protein
VRECEGMSPHTPKWTLTLGIEVSNIQRIISRVKTHWIKDFFIPLEIS